MARPRAQELKRQKKPRALKIRFVLFCEGANTEPHYFKALVRLLKLRMVEVEPVSAAGDPIGMAQRAAKWKSNKGQRVGNLESYDEGDQVWAVFDRDTHEHFDAALSLCEQSGINVARSNPCFKVWLILHHEDCHRPLTPHAAQKRLGQLCPEYYPKGSKTVDACKLIPCIDAAEARAQMHLAQREAEGMPFGPCSTTVHLLTQALRGRS